MPMIMANRYRILRRVVQISVLSLFVAGNAYGWKVLQGDLSSSLLFGTVPLADPFALLQVFATGTMVAAQALLGGGIVLLFFAVSCRQGVLRMGMSGQHRDGSRGHREHCGWE